jgi:A/G-specific adenine glycosylase
VLPVYSALLTTYPRPVDLAKAERAELVGFFASTGLRKRVQTLEAIGAAIAGAWNGRIPRSQAKLRAVPGIGQYIANAVLALAWRRRVPIVDWPVARVLRRAFGRSELSPPKSDSDLWNLAAGLLPARRSKEFSLAVLDLADLVCRPSKPRCPECPWMMHCVYNRRVTEGSACRVTGSPRETIVTGTDPLDT